ncbi:hypothetical protein PC123_g16028 [Phytophthora cactorum]|nr:hypothetical protein PC123_g16028 [Phytophthora cactorum]
MPHTPRQAHGQESSPRSAEQAPRSHRGNAPAPSAPRSSTAPHTLDEPSAYREQGSRLFRVEGSTRGNDLLSEELEEGQVDYEESVASEAHSDAASARSHASGVSFGAASARSYGSTTMSPPRRVLRSSNPFVERYNPVHALRDAPPLTSRYEED